MPGIPITTRLTLTSIVLITMLWAGTLLAQASAVTVEITGLEDAQADNVRAHLSLTDLEAGASERHVRRLFGDAPAEIRDALRALGYYEPAIDSDLETTADGWLVRFSIRPGPPVVVENIDYRIEGPGADDPVLKGLAADFPLQSGDTLNHARYQASKNRIRDAALQRGYFDFRFLRHRLEVDLVDHRADAILHVATGPRYRFGEVTLEQTTFRDDFLRRYLPFAPGDPYHQRELVELRQALTNSGYFSRVDVKPRRKATNGDRVPVVVRLNPLKQHEYRFGIGYGTDTGPRALTGWTVRHLNAKGHRADTELNVSAIRQRLEANYQIPLEDPAHDTLSYAAGIQQEEVDGNPSQRLTSEARLSHLRDDGWLFTRFLRLEQETFEIGATDERTTLLLPGVIFSRVVAKDRLNPREGHRLSLTLQGAHDSLLSDVSLGQAILRGKRIDPLGERNRLLTRVDLGGTLIDEFEEVPTSLRFFAGGDQSVRGYDYRQLGPEDESGEVVGGKYLAVASVEFEHRFREKWGVAAFVDTGNAYDEPGTDLKTGIGVGLRWFSPVGPLRLDFASPVDDDDRGLRIHFHMGPDL